MKIPYTHLNRESIIACVGIHGATAVGLTRIFQVMRATLIYQRTEPYPLAGHPARLEAPSSIYQCTRESSFVRGGPLPRGED